MSNFETKIYRKTDKYLIIFKRNNKNLTNAQVIDLMKNNSTFRSLLSRTILNIHSKMVKNGVYLKVSGINKSNLNNTFFMVVKSENFRPADPSSFKTHFKKYPGKKVIVFENLNKTSSLIVPCDVKKDYGHLISFLKNSNELERQELWKKTGARLNKLISLGKTIWLNTHGTGVPWLHVRLDPFAKYYSGFKNIDSKNYFKEFIA